MKTHHTVALGLAAVNAVLLAVDTVVLASTGERTWITDDGRGTPTTILVAAAVMGLTFAAGAVVVAREGRAFATAPRPARAARPVLLGGLVLLAVGFLVLRPVQVLLDAGEDPVSGLVALLGITGMSLAALVVGLASARDRSLGLGGKVLALLVPVGALTVLLYVVAPQMASPAYCTIVVLSGVALLGAGARRDVAVADGTPTSAAA